MQVNGHDTDIRKQAKKILYISPLKALSTERFLDWERRYPNHKILMLTGDTLKSAKERALQMAEAKVSDIIIATSELVDSLTRNYNPQKNTWLAKIGLVIIDESHIITMADRGHPVETGLMRFTKINSHARIMLLSATMPNCDELGDWLTKLNGKTTKVLFSNWRPVQLEKIFYEYPIYMQGYRPDYWAQQRAKRQKAVEITMSKPDEKFLIFVWDKGTGHEIVKMLGDVGEKAVFHNADLDYEERQEVEGNFKKREGGLRVMVSTNTCAWGLNVPARNVIITGVHRGINEVDELDIIQASGRAGRYGIDDAGFVHMIIPEGTTNQWKETFAHPRPVLSVLNNHHVLAFHTLAEIANHEITNARELLRWYTRSLAYHQNIDFTIDDAKGLLEDLTSMEMVVQREGSGIVTITGLGQVSATFYLSPYGVSDLYTNFNRLLPRTLRTITGEEEHLAELDDITLAWAIGDIATNSWGYTPKDCKVAVDEFSWKLRNRGIRPTDALHFGVGAYKALQNEEIKKNPFGMAMRAIRYDIDRIAEALMAIDKNYARWDRPELWKTLPLRIKYGVPAELVPLTLLPGIGGVKARKLWEAGVRSLSAVADPTNRSKLMTMFLPITVTRMVKKAQELTRNERAA